MGIALASGLAMGALVSLLAFLLARYGPTGSGWSFRGNGALVAYTLLPASLAAGWAALVLRSRSHRRWAAWGAAAGGVALVIAGVDAALIPVLGPAADRPAGPFLLLALVAWVGLAPLLAVKLPVDVGARTDILPNLVSAAGWCAGNLVGLVLVGLALPPGS